jgi:TetR/AcrR family transcriptional regulator, transcriptional repressor for nem operon
MRIEGESTQAAHRKSRYTMTLRHEKLAASRKKLLDASLYVIRAKGYSATSVDDICVAAGLSKGSFFHHFKSKEELALAAAEHFATFAENTFSSAPYRRLPDPVERLLAYVDFRKAIIAGELPQFTCLLGTMVQETYETHPAIRAACDKFITAHAATLEADIAAAMARSASPSNSSGPECARAWTPRSLALYTQAVIQGAFILAKAQQSHQVAIDSLDHLHRYLEFLFRPTQSAVLYKPITQPA